MEGFTPLEINLNGDDAWPELREQEFGHGMATHEVVLETTWNLLYSAARAIEARHGGAR